MKAVLDQIKREIPVSKIVSAVVPLKRSGNGVFLGLCPFHQEKSPSFYVFDIKGNYHCFGCGAHGDVINFVKEYEKIQTTEAIEKLAFTIGIADRLKDRKAKELYHESVPYFELNNKLCDLLQDALEYTVEGQLAKKYLHSRTINDQTIETFRIGYFDGDIHSISEKLGKDCVARLIKLGFLKSSKYSNFSKRIMFPIIAKDGKVLGFGGRSIDGREPKYLNSSESFIYHKGMELYGISQAIKDIQSSNQVILVEGYLDVISLHQAGIKNVVASLGTALTIEQLRVLWGMAENVVLCFDNDSAGKKATSKVIERILPDLLPNKLLRIMSLSGAKDPDEFVNVSGIENFKTLITQSQPLVDFIFDQESLKYDFNIPERLYGFKQRLTEIAQKINNAELAKFYKNNLISKFYNLLKGKKSDPNFGISKAKKPPKLETNTNRLLIYLVAKFPNLINDNIIYSKLHIIEDFHELTEYVNGILDYNFQAEIPKQLINEFSIYDFRFLNAKDPFEEAKSICYQIIEADEIESLSSEIEDLKRQLINDPNNEKLLERYQFYLEQLAIYSKSRSIT